MTDPRELIRVWDDLSWLAQRDASESYTQGFRDALEQALNERDAWRNEGEGGVSAYLDAIRERDAARAETQRLRQALRALDELPIREERSACWHFAEVRQIARAALAAAPTEDTEGRCPTCGSRVHVHTSDEGTSYYAPTEETKS